MPKVFLDLRNYDADRATLRRLEKQMKASPEFHSKSGRVFFFRFATELGKVQFFAAITHALTATGYRYIVTSDTEENLRNPN